MSCKGDKTEEMNDGRTEFLSPWRRVNLDTAGCITGLQVLKLENSANYNVLVHVNTFVYCNFKEN